MTRFSVGEETPEGLRRRGETAEGGERKMLWNFRDKGGYEDTVGKAKREFRVLLVVFGSEENEEEKDFRS